MVAVRLSHLAALLAVVTALPSPLSKRAPSILTPEVDRWVDGLLAEWGSPGGLGIAVVSLDAESEAWTVETKGYGNATSDWTPVDEDTMFPIGSNSKLFTALAAGVLLSDETLEPHVTLDTPIKDVMPGWELMDDVATAQTTLVDLFSHRTGLPRHDFMYQLNDTVTDLFGRLKHLRPSTSFRNAFQYNNLMYGVLSYLPTVLLPSQPLFTRYVKEHILDPLGLISTTYALSVAIDEHVLAQGFTRRGVDLDNPFDPAEPTAYEFWEGDVTEDGNFMSGAGGIIMNAKDAARWLQVLLLGGKNPDTGVQVIPTAVIDAAATGASVLQGAGHPIVYGAGQYISTVGGYSLVEHDGSVPGFLSSISRLPELGFGLAVLSNDAVYGSQLTTIVKKTFMDRFLGVNSTDHSAVVKESTIAAISAVQNATIPPPTDPTPPSVDYSAFEGTYTDAGYGSIDLCYVASNASCLDILVELPDAVDSETPTLVARWNKLWASHVRLQHFDGDVWKASALFSRPFVTSSGDRTGEYWTEDVSAGQTVNALFNISGDGVIGFGLTGGLWGSGVAPRSAQEIEVWFDRS